MIVLELSSDEAHVLAVALSISIRVCEQISDGAVRQSVQDVADREEDAFDALLVRVNDLIEGAKI